MFLRRYNIWRVDSIWTLGINEQDKRGKDKCRKREIRESDKRYWFDEYERNVG